ncbi:DUF2380 domain-containing protein [Starkeya sp. ORNL1]|uniref:DUF2380 domain-containing protein n=1 Tax=Starkeya sp. ORNL1 TaxID=2709380 RepID=UPI0014643BDF|nr:DUF2380 domain-containing protein [Starkeya sp. ORNL1]QJP16975.1 DUF2380 domain-containing protein [Starkeya sp. ORNL1]
MQSTSSRAQSPSRRWILLIVASALLALPLGMTVPSAADSSLASANAVRIAVFDFELEDHSAGSGIIAEDPHDAQYLSQATDEARRMLAASGRFVLVDTKGAVTGAEANSLRNCDGCAAAIAGRLGAEQAMIGVVTRVNRTEYTLLIRITDASTGATVSNSYTNLRMGANYAWPRGVKWLMDNQLLADSAAAK